MKRRAKAEQRPRWRKVDDRRWGLRLGPLLLLVLDCTLFAKTASFAWDVGTENRRTPWLMPAVLVSSSRLVAEAPTSAADAKLAAVNAALAFASTITGAATRYLGVKA